MHNNISNSFIMHTIINSNIILIVDSIYRSLQFHISNILLLGEIYVFNVKMYFAFHVKCDLEIHPKGADLF